MASVRASLDAGVDYRFIVSLAVGLFYGGGCCAIGCFECLDNAGPRRGLPYRSCTGRRRPKNARNRQRIWRYENHRSIESMVFYI